MCATGSVEAVLRSDASASEQHSSRFFRETWHPLAWRLICALLTVQVVVSASLKALLFDCDGVILESEARLQED